MNTKNKIIVTDFIGKIWNQNQFDSIENFLHAEFTDHSLPAFLSPDKKGLASWIKGTSKSFVHETIIEEMVGEEDKVMIRIKMHLKHVGEWRNFIPTGAEVFTTGYRYFKLSENKIIEHWALIDGNAIENQLKQESHGCKIPI